MPARARGYGAAHVLRRLRARARSTSARRSCACATAAPARRVVLLHGHPRTHTTWHRVAPLLAAALHRRLPRPARLRRVDRAADAADHAPYSKRAMARDVRRADGALGHERFAVAGHDRGSLRRPPRSRSTTRRRSTALAVLGRACRSSRRSTAATPASPRRGGTGSSSPRPTKPAEAIIAATPTPGTAPTRGRWAPRTYADWRRGVHDPAVVHAMFEDYRAGLGDRPRARRGRPRRRPPRRAARRWSPGRSTTTSRSSTATRSRSGARGPTTCAARGSTAATTWPRRRRRRPPRRWRRSGPRSAGPRCSAEPARTSRSSGLTGRG